VIRPAALATALILSVAAGPATAGEAACWVDNGAVVVSAAMGDIAGDFVLDLATPKTELHLTRALSEGIITPDFQAPVRLAGMNLGKADIAVANLNARTWGFTTEISGVIGADLLNGYVVDLTLTPTCRIALWRGKAPPFDARSTLKLMTLDGAPLVAAAVTDGTTTRSGLFALETGGAGVRLSPRIGALSRTRKGIDPNSRTDPPARLHGVRFAGDDWSNLPSALDPDAPADRLGDIGLAVWRRYAVRFDFKRRLLELKPASP
jgi:hypothetical protein